MKTSRYLTAQEATTELGISPATLYAYVSRGEPAHSAALFNASCKNCRVLGRHLLHGRKIRFWCFLRKEG